MLKKNFLITFVVIAMIATLGLIQGCSESDKVVEPIVKVDNDTGEDLDLLFELSAFDTANILWDYEIDKDRLDPPKATSGWWWPINIRIWGRAIQDNGRNVGVQCKPWANRVVRDATGFSLPSTMPYPNDFKFYPGGHVEKIVDGNVIGGGTIERGIGLGNIIQMHINTRDYKGPHTAIFYMYYGNGMYWIDSNWFSRYGYPNYVFIHYVSWDWFRKYVGTKYSVYQAHNW